MSWQDNAIEVLGNHLNGVGDVLAVVVLGSVAEARSIDEWSDLDLLVVVWPDAFPNFYPEFVNLYILGMPFAVERHQSPHAATIRIVLEDMHRIDAIITT